MKRMSFERPTEHYDERILHIDERMCSLIQQRKEISGHNPGYPPFELISKWAAAFGIYEDFLKSLFGTMLNEDHFRPMVEPAGFRKHIPVLKSVERDERFYALTSIRQYTNASVLVLSIDWDEDPEPHYNTHEPTQFELFIGEPYDCRMINGGSRSGSASYKYVVSPPLPDDITGMVFRFKGYGNIFMKIETGEEIVFAV